MGALDSRVRLENSGARPSWREIARWTISESAARTGSAGGCGPALWVGGDAAPVPEADRPDGEAGVVDAGGAGVVAAVAPGAGEAEAFGA